VRAREPVSGRAHARLPETLEARASVLARALGERDTVLLRERAHDYIEAMHGYFAREHDEVALLGQQNRFRYLPCPDLILRIEHDASLLDIASSCLAAMASASHVRVSIHPRVGALSDTSLLGFAMNVESSEAMAQRLHHATRIRVLGTRSVALDAINARIGAHIADEPVVPVARFELLHYLIEQTLSIEVHRYGNLPTTSSTREQVPSAAKHAYPLRAV
jgi:predicted DNA-binding protein